MPTSNNGNRRLNYDEELTIYEKLRINYSHIIEGPKSETDTILNSIFARTSLVRLWDKIMIDTEHPFPGNGGITETEALKLENGIKFLALYGSAEKVGKKNSSLVEVMKKTDPELVEEIIVTTKRVLEEIREKYRFEIITMHANAERAVSEDMSTSSRSRNYEEILSQILAKNAEHLRNEDFLRVFKKMHAYSIYQRLSAAAKTREVSDSISQEEIERLVYTLQFLKFLYLVRTENYDTKEILKFDKFLLRLSELHPDWLQEIDSDYSKALRRAYKKPK